MMQENQPRIEAAEVINAFQLLYPEKFEKVVQVISNAKRLALIPEEDDTAVES